MDLSVSYEFNRLRKPDFTRGTELIDNNIGKFSKGQFIILCGETGAGKTTFATFMARRNKGCCYYVLEDRVENIARLYALKKSNITKEELNNGTWGSKENDYERYYNYFINSGIDFINVGKKMTIEALEEDMLAKKAEGASLFFIDNLGFITGDGRNEERQTAYISNKLVSFCLNQSVCVVLLHHFKKQQGIVEYRNIGQMRGSGKLGDDATMVVQYGRDGDSTYLQVYKDRGRGQLKTYNLRYDRGDFEFLEENSY